MYFAIFVHKIAVTQNMHSFNLFNHVCIYLHVLDNRTNLLNCCKLVTQDDTVKAIHCPLCDNKEI